MGKKFKIENLPNEVYDKIEDIVFYPKWEADATGNLGLVYLRDGYMFDFDNSHVAAFTSRNDLINLINGSVVIEKR